MFGVRVFWKNSTKPWRNVWCGWLHLTRKFHNLFDRLSTWSRTCCIALHFKCSSNFADNLVRFCGVIYKTGPQELILQHSAAPVLLAYCDGIHALCNVESKTWLSGKIHPNSRVLRDINCRNWRLFMRFVSAKNFKSTITEVKRNTFCLNENVGRSAVERGDLHDFWRKIKEFGHLENKRLE